LYLKINLTKMKMKLMLICFCVMLFNSMEAQLIQGTLRKGSSPNQVEVWIKPNFTNSTQYLYQLGLPIAFPSGATPTPTGLSVSLDASFISTFGNLYSVSVYTLANSTDNQQKYFNIVLIRGAGTGGAGSLPQPWTAGQEYKVLTATFQGSSASAKVRLADYQDGGSDGQANFYTQDGNNNYYVTSNSIGNFYGPGAGDPLGASVGGNASAGYAETNALISLPVNMLNFSGYKSGTKNILNWRVAGEINNRGYDVLRSTDGVNYSSIGFVNSQSSGGFSTTELNYTFTDNNPVGKKQYYRLNQKDIDGNSKLSNIIVLSGDKPTQLGIGGLFPNPARDRVNVMIEAPQRDKITIVVTDMSGKIVKQQLENVDTGSNTVPVDIANLASGSYLVKLRCQSSDCETASAKFNKQ
jgi:Secretion system C-terminal sorting domain